MLVFSCLLARWPSRYTSKPRLTVASSAWSASSGHMAGLRARHSPDGAPPLRGPFTLAQPSTLEQPSTPGKSGARRTHDVTQSPPAPLPRGHCTQAHHTHDLLTDRSQLFIHPSSLWSRSHMNV
uniref:Uncharacterized protein n=1 Tax=Haptolina brevifila TaxID=156173 RepID=A0A7S2NN77_9EUKA